MIAPDWLTARPVAHRGLHDRAGGIIENTLPAIDAAIAGHFAIEVDIQLARDGEALVFHDFTLERLTHGEGPVASLDAAALRAIRFKETDARIPTLGDLLARVDGRVPLFLEVKSRFDGAPATLRRMAALLADYSGPVAVMSFDPEVTKAGHDLFPGRPIGIVAEMFGDHPEWKSLSRFQKFQLSHLNHFYDTRPDFIAYNVNHLPSPACDTLRFQRGVPLLTWTARTEAQREAARKHADQMIFEGKGA